MVTTAPPLTPTPNLATAHTPQVSGVIAVTAPSESIVKRIESHLRNAGHPLRCVWLTDLEEVEDALRSGTPELLIHSNQLPMATLEATVALGKRLMPDLPILLLCDEPGIEQAPLDGVADIISSANANSLQRLERVILREQTTHSQLRELRSLRARLADFEARHQHLITQTNDAIAHIQEGIITYVNPAFAQLLGYPSGEELTALPLMDLVATEHQSKTKDRIKRLLRGKADDKTLECSLRHQDGHTVAIAARIALSRHDNEPLIEMLIRIESSKPTAGQPPLAENQTPASSADQIPAADRSAYFDALNARIATAAQSQQQHAALMIIIDDFPGAEQRLGFYDAAQAADECGKWLHAQLEPHDRIFRFSVHEFACLVSRSNAAAIVDLGEALVKQAQEQIFNTSEHEAHLCLSIGAYPFSDQQTATAVTTELVEQTRQSSAKQGQQFANYGPNAESSLQERNELRKADMVRKALAENRLKLAYQSIASLEGDPRQHYDVLVRVIDESGKEHHAAEFIEAAEKYELIGLIDRWVTTRVLKVQSKRDGAEEVSSLFIKLSQASIKDADAFIPWLQQALANRPLKPGEVVFEVQERVAQDHIRKIRMFAKAAIELGAQVAMEHFGIGSSSAQMIEHIPLQFIKFHPSFSANFAHPETRKKMADLMTRAKQKNIRVIMSHVEDANTMAQLWQMGVNFIQGFHVQEPEMVLLSANLHG